MSITQIIEPTVEVITLKKKNLAFNTKTTPKLANITKETN